MITSQSINRGGLGRFGNQLFTIAGVIGIATRSGQPYGFPEWINHDNALFGGKPDRLRDFLANPLPTYIPEVNYQEYGYFWGYRDIYLPSGSWTIDAHLQSERFFAHCIDLVRHYFTFRDEPKPSNKVAVHWRAGDYSDDPDAYHPRQRVDYYILALQQFPNSEFLIFTDDKAEAEKRFAFMDAEVVSGNYIEDFKLMKNCHSFITANSSYSLMAAILGDQPGKKIVCPRKWFGPTVNLETKDIYPSNAVII